MKLKLDQICYDQKYYPRVNGDSDWLTVHRYTDALKSPAGAKFPPVHVVRATGFKLPYLLIDGKHRTAAHVRAGLEEIEAIIETIPRSKWFARSVELNSHHGRGLDTGDKAWIAERLNEEGYSETEVAKLLFMTVESLQKIRVTRVVHLTAHARKTIQEGRGNRSLNKGAIGILKAPVIGATAVMTALQCQDSVSSHSVCDVLDSFIAIMRAGVVEMGNEEIAAKVSIIRELLDAM